MKRLTILICTLLSIVNIATAQRIPLAGEWSFSLDPERRMKPTENFSEKITLPGTTDEAGFGKKSTKSDFGILTREWKYTGLAWYSREIEIPQQWAGKRVFLELERVTWQSKLYIDGKELSMQESLISPHIHDLGMLTPGRHRVSISIDNSQIYNIGDKGHIYGEYTQSIWNGAIGRIELFAKPTVRLTNPQVYTKIDPRSITITDTLTIENGKNQKLKISYELRDRLSDELVWQQTTEQITPNVNLTANLPASVKLWDDVNPNLYNLTILLADGKGLKLDEKKIEIGFREVINNGTRMLVNGKPVFLRGNLDCVHFPLTGYPAADIEGWERIFRIYKEYGLNHVRFHSWTPTEAAFIAANRQGIYIQSEVLWIDWWMAIEQPDRPEMFTQGMPKGLGENPSADTFTKDELRRMIYWYGNNPSFVMMCIGNELGNSNFELMESWMKSYKDSDPRRIYASSTARKINPSDQYMATHYIDKVGSTRGLRGGASLNWDFEDTYSKSPVPTIAHEIGQWPVYPRWSEIKKYKGTLKAMNFEEFAEVARKNGIYDHNEAFVAASGALNQLMYKYEIESFLRTPSCAGIQLLSMQDYQGQGEALIGWLDAFWDSKGITTPEKFRRHHDTIVPLLRLPKFVWSNNESLSAKIQLAQWGSQMLTDAINWKIEDGVHNVIARGTIPSRSYNRATSEIVGELGCSLAGVKKAQKLKITVELATSDVENSWDIWVYPAKAEMPSTEVYQTNRFDKEAIARLERGESVLLDASELGTELTADQMGFYPLYWSLTFFPGQGRNTIGMVVQDAHPVFGDFPTDSHSDWQWQSIYKGARCFYINGFPSDYRPMAQPVDDFHRNNFVAAIYELKVGNGKLLVSGFNLQDKNNTVAQQLRKSMLDYMNSDKFNPTYAQPTATLQETFRHIEPLKSEVPAEFDGALLYIESAALQNGDGDQKWSKSQDKVTAIKNTTYELTGAGTYRDEAGAAWHGTNMELKINCPKGVIGSLYLFFHDWNDASREANLVFEGRDYKLGRHAKDGKWVKLHVMREDSNKGFLTLNIKTAKGGNTMLSKVVLLEDK